MLGAVLYVAGQPPAARIAGHVADAEHRIELAAHGSPASTACPASRQAGGDCSMTAREGPDGRERPGPSARLSVTKTVLTAVLGLAVAIPTATSPHNPNPRIVLALAPARAHGGRSAA